MDNVSSIMRLLNLNSALAEQVVTIFDKRVLRGEPVSKADFFKEHNIDLSLGNYLYRSLLKDLIGSAYDNPGFYLISIAGTVGLSDEDLSRAFEMNDYLGELSGFDPVKVAASLLYIAHRLNGGFKGFSYFNSKGFSINKTVSNLKGKHLKDYLFNQ